MRPEADDADEVAGAPSAEGTCDPARAAARPGSLELRGRGERWRHHLLGRPVHGGDPIELCFSGGWVTGRYEWAGPEHPPRFFFSVELGGGRVWESSLELPEGALLRWPARRPGETR